ncbi:hypothetical protein E3O06_01045 [Cryobacterium glaciale]|uniref:Uncharacterized protein n=1 Tax=Cryobacterium glaciale TaxID=1259145 RepID=A0A4V3I9V3_9MICO|nr:hypothetical protein [Cryobacterium glaciale]TFB77367.1 hypothetical protein E3O06_01045 [Cryobacterium glaciale]
MQTPRGSSVPAPIERARRRAVPPPRLRVRSLALAAASAFLAVILATTAAGGTYALLNSSAATPSSTMTSGTATMTVSPLALPAVALYPGLVIAAPVTVTNTGDVPLSVTVSSLIAPTVTSNLSGSLVIGLVAVANAAACTSGVSPTWTGTFAAAPPGAVGAPLAQAQSQTLCVSVALAVNAPDSSQTSSAANFSVVLTGGQA